MKPTLITCALIISVAGLASAAPTTLITFDEFPLGTVISNQYAGQGVIFLPGTITPRLPQISMNGAMPTAPVLRPTGEPDYYIFQGDFSMEFPNPAIEVQFTSGYWDSVGVGVIEVYDPSNNLIATLTNTTTGVNTTSISAVGPIGRIYFNTVADGAGADMDNLEFQVIPKAAAPATGTLGLIGIMVLLLGLGVVRLRATRIP